MKFDLDKPLNQLDGKPFEGDLTIGKAMFIVMNAQVDGDQSMGVDQRMKQFGLLKIAHEGGVVTLSSEEVSLVKARAAKVLSTMAFGVLAEALESPMIEATDAPA